MRDTDLYGQILGLQAPWFVQHVDLDAEIHGVRPPERPRFPAHEISRLEC
jgi:hypothetical protein